MWAILRGNVRELYILPALQEEGGGAVRFEITEVHVVDIPDDEYYAMEDPIEEIKYDAPWFISLYGCDGWCEEVSQLGRPL